MVSFLHLAKYEWRAKGSIMEGRVGSGYGVDSKTELQVFTSWLSLSKPWVKWLNLAKPQLELKSRDDHSTISELGDALRIEGTSSTENGSWYLNPCAVNSNYITYDGASISK